MTDPDSARPDPALRESLLPRVLPLRGLATATIALVAATCLASILTIWADWYRYGVVRDYLADEPGVLDADLDIADWTVLRANLLYLGVLAAAGITFIVWLYRARSNAEIINGAEHRRSRGWVIGSWFCPIVNLWFPFQVVDDVYRTSDPDAPADLYRVTGLPSSPLVRWWWAAFLAADLIGLWFSLGIDADLVGWLRKQVVVNIVTTALLCLAAVLLARIVRQVSQWQVIPRPPREEWRRA
jgi:hypothetical protein